MNKRKKRSSLIQYNGIIGKIRRIIDAIAYGVFPKEQVFYVAGEENALIPAMSRRQISLVKNKICKAAIKGFNSCD